jgi:nucleotidyltransferase/DNA polymerase involved in DNA repair
VRDEARCILHVDMDAFYASIEQLDHPHLRGKPLLVGHDGPRGVVTTASYEARPFGCRSAQPMAVAKRLCPQAIVVPTRFERYHEVSARVFDILDDFTPQIEPLSVDEAFLDVTASRRLLGDGPTIARSIKRRIFDELKITASVGVAPNKFLAKLASDLEKPDGLTVITAADVDRVLPPLPVTKIWGIGPKTAARLQSLAINTIGDVRRIPLDVLARRFGSEGERYHRLAHGLDDRPVVPDSEAKSIGHEQTFGTDLTDPEEVRSVLLGQVEQVARRLRKHGLRARSVHLKIRDGAFHTVTRATTLREPSDSTKRLWEESKALFEKWAHASFKPVRLIGMSASSLTQDAPQLGLFIDRAHEQQQRVDEAVDRINSKFGKTAIRRGREPRPSSLPPPE